MGIKHSGQVVPEITQEEHQGDILAKRVMDIGTNQQTRIEYDANNNPWYIGIGAKGLASSAIGWLIQKFTWDANQNVTLIQTAYGAWDNRQNLVYE